MEESLKDLEVIKGAMFGSQKPFLNFLGLIRDGDSYFVVFAKRDTDHEPDPDIYHFQFSEFSEVPESVHRCAYELTKACTPGSEVEPFSPKFKCIPYNEVDNSLIANTEDQKTTLHTILLLPVLLFAFFLR